MRPINEILIEQAKKIIQKGGQIGQEHADAFEHIKDEDAYRREQQQQKQEQQKKKQG